MAKKQKKKVVVDERETNQLFSKNNEAFKNACEAAGIKATKRQASRFRMGKGLAYKHKGVK